jgi:hypothetical protein
VPSPILARADALMQRRRQVGSSPFDDVPILTDTIEAEDTLAPTPASSMTPATRHLADSPELPDLPDLHLDQISTELAARVIARLNHELPRLVESVVTEFMAERKASSPTRTDA